MGSPWIHNGKKGDELIILEEYNEESFWDYLVQDINKECNPFYVKKDEIKDK